jgi:hypothetical protein
MPRRTKYRLTPSPVQGDDNPAPAVRPAVFQNATQAMRLLLPILLILTLSPVPAWATEAAARIVSGHPPGPTGAAQAARDKEAANRPPAGAILSAQPNLPLPKGAPHMRGELRRYAQLGKPAGMELATIRAWRA